MTAVRNFGKKQADPRATRALIDTRLSAARGSGEVSDIMRAFEAVDPLYSNTTARLAPTNRKTMRSNFNNSLRNLILPRIEEDAELQIAVITSVGNRALSLINPTIEIPSFKERSTFSHDFKAGAAGIAITATRLALTDTPSAPNYKLLVIDHRKDTEGQRDLTWCKLPLEGSAVDKDKLVETFGPEKIAKISQNMLHVCLGPPSSTH